MWRNMKRLTMAAAGVLVILPTTAGAAPIRYDCDTAAGSFSLIDFVQPGPNYRVTGRMSAVKFRKHDKWAPGAMVQLVSADQKSGIGIRIQGESERGPVELFLRSLNGGKESDASLGTLLIGESMPFAIEVVGGTVTVQAAGQRFNGEALIGAGATMKISCSTGEFRFDELDWNAPITR